MVRREERWGKSELGIPIDQKNQKPNRKDTKKTCLVLYRYIKKYRRRNNVLPMARYIDEKKVKLKRWIVIHDL